MKFGSLLNLGSLMKDMLRTAEVEHKLQEHTCITSWDEIVGEKVSAAAQPEFVRDGVMFVITKSAVWSNELTFYKKDIITRLNQRAGGTVLKEMVFKVGKVSRKKKPAAEIRNDKPDLEGIKLSDDELKQIESVSVNAGAENAEAFKQAMITSSKIEKWKKSQGFTPCKKCGTLQNSKSGMCPICVWPG